MLTVGHVYSESESCNVIIHLTKFLFTFLHVDRTVCARVIMMSRTWRSLEVRRAECEQPSRVVSAVSEQLVSYSKWQENKQKLLLLWLSDRNSGQHPHPSLRRLSILPAAWLKPKLTMQLPLVHIVHEELIRPQPLCVCQHFIITIDIP